MSGSSRALSSSVSSAFGYGQPSLKLETTSELDLEEFVLHWKLNVSDAVLKSEPLKSPIFVGGVRSQHSWQLIFMPFDTYWAVKVILSKIGNEEFSVNGEEVRAKAFISLKNPDIRSHLEIQQERKHLQLSRIKPGTNDLPSLLSENTFQLLVNNRKKYNGNENPLMVYCRIIIKCGMKHSEIRQTMLPCFEGAQNEVAVGSTHHSANKTLKTLYNSSDFSDVMIETETARIPAHKAILAAQSPVFKAMFRTGMMETRRNVVKINDFGATVVKAMLEFIYTGKASDLTDPGNVADLFRISDKYGLLELKDVCEQKLCSKLNVENASEFFHLATLHNAKTLKVFALRFIHENKLKVGETEFFKKLIETDPDILLELYLSI